MSRWPGGDGRARSRLQPPGLTARQRGWLDYMLSQLGFAALQMRYVSLAQTTRSYARYEQFRQRGATHRQAVERLLYGERAA